MNRTILSIAAPLALLACTQSAAAATLMVTKTATCPCCKDWVEHMKKAGFKVQVRDVEDLTPVARKLGVPDTLRSCHTSQTGGYTIEGHVPAADVKRLLAAKPKGLGLAVPGMVPGSPGMDQGSTRVPYKVLLFQKDGKTSVFASH
jgi:hypothetical protein